MSYTMKPGPTHVALLNAIYGGLKQSGKWPPFSYVDRVLDRQGFDTENVIRLLTPDLSSLGPGRVNNDAEEVSLTIAGLVYCTGAESDLALILKTIQMATKIE